MVNAGANDVPRIGCGDLDQELNLIQTNLAGASKAGLSMYVNSARVELRRKGITVTDILPGYVKTDIVEGVDIGKLPFAISVEQAAHEMTRLIERRVKSGSVPALPWKLVRPFLGHLPQRFTRV